MKMKHISGWTFWSCLILALVLSPVALILAVPMAIGFGLDVFELAGERMMVAALCVPLLLWLLRRLGAFTTPRRAIVWLWSRLHLEQAAHLIHAP